MQLLLGVLLSVVLTNDIQCGTFIFVAGNERAFLLDRFGWLGPEHLIRTFFIIFPYMHFGVTTWFVLGFSARLDALFCSLKA